MSNFKFLSMVFVLFVGCSYSVQSQLPTIDNSHIKANSQKETILILPSEFVNYQFTANDLGVSYKVDIGQPATEAIKNLVSAKFEKVQLVNVNGNGDYDLFKIATGNPKSVVIRPRFADARYQIPARLSIAIMLDIVDSNKSLYAKGKGDCRIWMQGTQPVQYAADTILAESMGQLTNELNKIY